MASQNMAALPGERRGARKLAPPHLSFFFPFLSVESIGQPARRRTCHLASPCPLTRARTGVHVRRELRPLARLWLVSGSSLRDACSLLRAPPSPQRRCRDGSPRLRRYGRGLLRAWSARIASMFPQMSPHLSLVVPLVSHASGRKATIFCWSRASLHPSHRSSARSGRVPSDRSS